MKHNREGFSDEYLSIFVDDGSDPIQHGTAIALFIVFVVLTIIAVLQ